MFKSLIDYPFSVTFFVFAILLFWATYFLKPYAHDTVEQYENTSGVVEIAKIESFVSERSKKIYYELAIYLKDGKRFFVRRPARDILEDYLAKTRPESSLHIYHLPAESSVQNFRIVHAEGDNGSIVDIDETLEYQGGINKVFRLLGFLFLGLFVPAYFFEYRRNRSSRQES